MSPKAPLAKPNVPELAGSDAVSDCGITAGALWLVSHDAAVNESFDVRLSGPTIDWLARLCQIGKTPRKSAHELSCGMLAVSDAVSGSLVLAAAIIDVSVESPRPPPARVHWYMAGHPPSPRELAPEKSSPRCSPLADEKKTCGVAIWCAS
jgi:hypothetical protein